MFYDLNVPWSANDQNLPKTLAFLHELGYNVVALNHTMSGKLPNDLINPIPDPPPHPGIPGKLTVLRRVTLVLTESHQNARLAALAKEFDILALRPIDEKSLQLACGSLDCDVISLDLTPRLPFFFKHKMLSEAVRAGKRIELCYSQGVLGDAPARRNLISNATQLIRACRGRGMLISSETKAGAVGCRGPWDAINLATLWGLSQERAHEAMSKEARSVVVRAQLKKSGYRGAVDVVYGGEKPPAPVKSQGGGGGKGQRQQGNKGQDPAAHGQKRKADAMEKPETTHDGAEKPISKREAKRRAKQARLEDGVSAAPIAPVPTTDTK